MFPAQPPLPTACSLPFHPPPPPATAGSQISILMSESLDGVSVAATRQNAGRSANGFAPRPRAGGVNAPAATVWADVIVVFGSLSDERLSHVAACADAATRIAIPATPRPLAPGPYFAEHGSGSHAVSVAATRL